MKFSSIRALSLSAVLLSASFANAGIITQWGWNLNPTSTAVVPLQIGTGTYNNAFATAAGVGTTIAPASGLASLLPFNFPTSSVGSSNDTAVAVGKNGYATQNSAGAADASVQGVQFHVSTAGMDTIGFQIDFKPGSRASKYWQVMYTSDGTTWQNVPTNGVGQIQNASVYSGTTLSNSGLLTITAPSNLTSTAALNTTANWMQGVSYQFPSLGAWENNANFGVGLFQIYNPSPSGLGDTGYVSAFAGTNNTDGTTGYIRSSGAGGTQRFDLVTVTGLPEPTALAGLGVIGLTALSRRRKIAK